jgi:hypothetical protein
MRALRTRIPLVLFLILSSPVVTLAGNTTGEPGESLWDWVVRLLAWAAGGWHYY